MAKVNESVWLNARPEEVWPFIVEPERLMQWRTDIRRFEILDEEPAGVGTRFYIEKEVNKEMRRFDCVIERLDENRRFAFTGESPGFASVQAGYEIAPEGEGCWFVIQETVNVSGINPLVDRLFVQRGLARTIRGFLARLRSVVEGNVTR